MEARTEALIVRHIADLDAASRLVEEKLDPMLERALERLLKQWAREHKWESGGDWKKTYPFVFPSDWNIGPRDGEGKYQDAWFEVDAVESQSDAIGGSSYWIARLCGIGGSIIINWNWTKDGYKLKDWKAFAAKHVADLKGAGFNYDEGSGGFFIPIKMDAEQVADAVESNTFEDALRPVVYDALDRCFQAKGRFDKILKAAKSPQAVPGAK